MAIKPPSAPSIEEGTKAPVAVALRPRSSAYAAAELPAPSFRSPPVRNKRFRRAALATAAFFLSGVALLFICKRLSSNLTKPGLPHRRLAEGFEKEGESDDELDIILNQCLELEAEHGDFHPDTDFTEPDAKKAKLVAFLEEAASSYTSAGQQAPISEVGLITMPSWTHELEWPDPTHPSELQSAGEVLTHWTSSADSASLADSAAPEGVSLPGLDIDPVLDPEAFLEQIPPLTQERGQKGREPLGPTVLRGGAHQQQRSLLGALTQGIRPTRSSGTQQLGPEEHPFFRLPKILPRAIRRKFRLTEVYRGGFSGTSCFQMLQKMRELFLKPVLGPEDVEELLRASESLVLYTRGHVVRERLTRLTPIRIIRQLGLHFMILDSLVCARQLLGPDMVPEQWWDALAGVFSTDYVVQPYEKAKEATKHNYSLIAGLRAAVELLKTGVRPSAAEIVKLKKMLFCSPYSAARFKDSQWNCWRQDAEMYARTHEDIFESSDDEES
ncbi:hypothetical protein Emag_007642 [Eimeria magna]